MQKYKFGKQVTEYNDSRYKPPQAAYTFYQLCSYACPKSGLHNIRIVQFNQDNEIIKTTTRRITEQQYQKFMSTHRDIDYKQYAAYDLDIIEYPNGDDLLKVHSELLS